MKKTIISIIGIAVMLLAITACRPNYVIVPIPGGGTSSTPSGTPVSDAGELQQALANGEDVYLTKTVNLPEGFQIPENSTIDGNGNTMTVPEGTNPGTGIMDIAASGVTLKNVTLDFTAPSATGASLLAATARAADEDTYAVLIGSGNGDMDNAPSGITLSHVTIKTGGNIAGINVHTAKDVRLENITIDYCLKAPVNISSSTNVTIDGIYASGSSWYKDNVIQVNGMDGDPEHKASKITFKSTGNINRVWVEAVAANYEAAKSVTDSDFNKGEQTVIDGLNWKVRYSDQASKSVKGWTYYKSKAEATTFTLNEGNSDKADDELVAMIAAVRDSKESGRAYDVIKLSQDVTLDKYLDVNTAVTIDGADNTIKPVNPETSFHEGPYDEFVLISADGVKFQNVVVDGIDTNDGTEAGDWDGEYAIRVYAPDTENQIKVTFSDVTIKDADVGMLVRGGDVTLEGVITFENLDWGGIGVDSIGSNPELIYKSTVTVASGCTINYTNGGNGDVVKPAIWTERTNEHETVLASSLEMISRAEAGSEEQDHQTWYVTTNFDKTAAGIDSEESVQ